MTRERDCAIHEDAAPSQSPKPDGLAEFLNELPTTPENKKLSREEIQQYIQQERQDWNK